MSYEEAIERFKKAISERDEMDKVLNYALGELRKVDRFFEWPPVFQNLINLGIIDQDDPAKEFRDGLVEFYGKFLSEIKEVENSDLSFIEGTSSDMDRLLFHEDMVVGICLINDVTCYNEEEKKIVHMIGGCILRKCKHDHTLQRITKLGDTSHLFEDPDVIEKAHEEELRKQQEYINSQPAAQAPPAVQVAYPTVDCVQ